MTFDDDEEEEEEDSDDDDVLMLVTSAVQCNAQIPVIAMALIQEAEQHSWQRSRRQRTAQEMATAPRILRNPTLFDERLKWDVFIRRFGGRAEFKIHLRMLSDSFTKLLSRHIRPSLEVDAEMARKRGGKIHPELCLYACLRFLAGGSYSDLRFFTGMNNVLSTTSMPVVDTALLANRFTVAAL